MKEWFLSTELIGLDGMPKKVGSISVRANRENWKSQKSKTGGRSLEYHISNFDDNIKKQLTEKFNDSFEFNGSSEEFPSDEYIEELVVSNNIDGLKECFQRAGRIQRPSKNVKLDLYDIKVSASSSALVIQYKQYDGITFSGQFIDNVIGVNTENVFLMPVKGDSMAPTLKNQAIIMVNRTEDFSGDGVYVFRFETQLMVKRLQFTKTGLNVVSDNKLYKPWQLLSGELTIGNFEIIGEVVWSGQKI